MARAVNKNAAVGAVYTTYNVTMKWNRVPYDSAVTRCCNPWAALEDISRYFSKILGSPQQFTDYIQGTWFHEDGTKVQWQMLESSSLTLRFGVVTTTTNEKDAVCMYTHNHS